MPERDSSPPPPLAQTTCWLLADSGPVMGALLLTAQMLHFEPEPGAEEHGARLPLAHILGATVTPIKERLLVQTLSCTRWFSGPGVPTLGRRLEALLHAPSGSGEEAPRLAADEPLLVSGTARWGLLRGELWLTDRRLRFVLHGLWGWLARRWGRSDWLEVSRAQAQPLLADGAISLEGLGVRLTGTAAHQAAAHLAAPEPLALAWPTRWRQGGRLSRWGVLSLDGSHLHLLSRGSADSCAVPLAQIHRLAVRWGALQIHLCGETAPLRLSAPAPRLLLRRLVRAVLEGGEATAAASAARDPDRSRLALRGVRWHPDGTAELGCLEQQGPQLQFVPVADDAPPLVLRREALRRLAAPAQAIRIEQDGQTLNLEPAGGGHAVEQFWRTQDIPERVQPWPREAADQERLLSDPRCITLSGADLPEIVLRPGMLVVRPEGFGILMPDTAPLPPEGTVLSIEIGRMDGIYQMEARLVGTAPLPTLRFPRSGQVFVFAPPDEVRFFNQRSAFRVSLQMPISAWKLRLDERRSTWIPDGDRITGQLIDLSISGCALHTRTTVAIGEHLFLELLIDDHWLPLEVECMRSEPGWPEGTNLGLRFLNLPERLEQLLSRTVLAQQRVRAPGG